MEWVCCAQCAVDAAERLIPVPDIKRKARDAFHLVRCRQCGLVYLNPRPTDLEMRGYYDSTYGPHASAYVEAAEHVASDDWYYRGRVEQLLGYLPQDFRRGRLLDVGCGDGYWLSLMQVRNWQVKGVEISQQAAAFAQERYGLAVCVGELDAHKFLAESFDLVTFWHSLEHMRDPKTALQEACRILRTGGVATVQVPNIDTVLFRVFGQHYSMIQAPFHLYHFSPSTLRPFLEENGFEVYQTVYSPGTDGIAVSLKNWWSSIQPRGKQGRPGREDCVMGAANGSCLTRLKREVVLPMLKPVGRLLALIGQGDVFSMYARKR